MQRQARPAGPPAAAAGQLTRAMLLHPVLRLLTWASNKKIVEGHGVVKAPHIIADEVDNLQAQAVAVAGCSNGKRCRAAGMCDGTGHKGFFKCRYMYARIA